MCYKNFGIIMIFFDATSIQQAYCGTLLSSALGRKRVILFYFQKYTKLFRYLHFV